MDDPDLLSTAALSAKVTWWLLYLMAPCLIVLIAIFLRYVRFALREVGWLLRTALAIQDVGGAGVVLILVGQNAFHWPWLLVWSMWLLPVCVGMILVSLLMKLWITFSDRGRTAAVIVPPMVGLIIYALRGMFLR